MFQSVTYTGFEKHPKRLAWVERKLMPLVRDVLRKESGPLSVYWHNPSLASTTPEELVEIVRHQVTPQLEGSSLVGSVNGKPAESVSGVAFRGVLLVLVSERLPAGWTYIPLPRSSGVGAKSPDRGPHRWQGRVQVPRSTPGRFDGLRYGWAVRSLYLQMLSAAMDQRQAAYREDPIPAGE